MPTRELLLPADIVSAIIILSPDLSILEEDFIDSVNILYKKDKKQIRDAIDYAVILNLLNRHKGYLVLNQQKFPKEYYSEE